MLVLVNICPYIHKSSSLPRFHSFEDKKKEIRKESRVSEHQQWIHLDRSMTKLERLHIPFKMCFQAEILDNKDKPLTELIK